MYPCIWQNVPDAGQPGSVVVGKEPIVLNAGRQTVDIMVTNLADRPIPVAYICCYIHAPRLRIHALYASSRCLVCPSSCVCMLYIFTQAACTCLICPSRCLVCTSCCVCMLCVFVKVVYTCFICPSRLYVHASCVICVREAQMRTHCTIAHTYVRVHSTYWYSSECMCVKF